MLLGWRFIKITPHFNSIRIINFSSKRIEDKNIYPRCYFYPSINTFNKLFPSVSVPCSEDFASRILCLPLYYDLLTNEMDRIIKMITMTLSTHENKTNIYV